MSEGIVLEDVRAGYGSTEVLRGISLCVGQNETVALLGPNGCGKSTVAKTIMNLTTLYSGRIRWDGRDISGVPTYKRAGEGLGYLPQVDCVFPGLSVGENLSFSGSRLPRRELAQRIEEVYERFPQLGARKRVDGGKLSGGERRLLGLATMIIQNPRFLILDEPTSDLAPAAIDLVFDKIREIRDELRLPLLLIEQNVERATELANRVCILIQGSLACDRACCDITHEEIGRMFLQRDTRK
jgi:ABC-type branched-subunit amino acid transport system ATPase component